MFATAKKGWFKKIIDTGLCIDVSPTCFHGYCIWVPLPTVAWLLYCTDLVYSSLSCKYESTHKSISFIFYSPRIITKLLKTVYGLRKSKIRETAPTPSQKLDDRAGIEGYICRMSYGCKVIIKLREWSFYVSIYL